MKFIFLTIFLATTQLVFSQENLEAYYNHTHKAEHFIIDNRLDSAELYFRKAFTYRQHPFARHLYISAIVNSKLGNFKAVSGALVSLIELGLRFEKISQVKLFSNYLKSKEGKRLAKIQKNIKHTYDPAYRLRIEQMAERDQFFRTKPGSYATYGDTIKKIDQENVDSLLMLIKTKGFPTEQKIGIDENLSFAPLFSILFIHQSNGPLQQYDFSELLRQNVRNGNIENKEGYFLFNRVSGGNFMEIVRVQQVQLIDSLKSRGNPSNHIVLNTSKWGYLGISEKEKENAKRLDFLLEDYDSNLKKDLFALQNNDFDLMQSPSSKSTLLVFSKKDFDSQILALNFFE